MGGEDEQGSVCWVVEGTVPRLLRATGCVRRDSDVNDALSPTA